VFVVVSRSELIASRFSSVICAPIYSAYHDLDSQVAVGVTEGLKHESSIHCDELVSLPKAALTDFVARRHVRSYVNLTGHSSLRWD